jgi:hypothetical protein
MLGYLTLELEVDICVLFYATAVAIDSLDHRLAQRGSSESID